MNSSTDINFWIARYASKKHHFVIRPDLVRCVFKSGQWALFMDNHFLESYVNRYEAVRAYRSAKKEYPECDVVLEEV